MRTTIVLLGIFILFYVAFRKKHKVSAGLISQTINIFFKIRIDYTTIKGDYFSEGSGFLIRPNLIITNTHIINCVGFPETIKSTLSIFDKEGNEHEGHIVYVDNYHDITLIKTKKTYDNFVDSCLQHSNILCENSVFAPKYDNADILEIEKHKITIFHGFIMSSTQMNISGTYSQLEKDNKLIFSKIKLVPGSSGSPLINYSGKLIGVNVGRIKDENIGVAISVSVVNDIVQKYHDDERMIQSMILKPLVICQ